MRTPTIVWIVVVILIILGGWYWWTAQSAAAPTSTSTDSTVSTSSSQTTVSIIGDNFALGTDSNATLGSYLIGYTGMTVYTYSKDTGTTSTCYETCAQTWPPYIVSPSDNINQLESGVTGTVGTTTRTDGSLQLTYDGHPLYFYSGDKTGDDANGDGIGGIWHVAKP